MDGLFFVRGKQTLASAGCTPVPGTDQIWGALSSWKSQPPKVFSPFAGWISHRARFAFASFLFLAPEGLCTNFMAPLQVYCQASVPRSVPWRCLLFLLEMSPPS